MRDPTKERGRLQAAGRSENWLHSHHITFAGRGVRPMRLAKRMLRDLCIAAITRDVALPVRFTEGADT